MPDPSPFPPPPPTPPGLERDEAPESSAGNGSRLLAIVSGIATIAVVLAVVFAFIGSTAAGRRDDAERERDLTVAERNDANATVIGLRDELAATKDQLAAAETSDAGGGPDRAAELQTEVDTLNTEIDRLNTQIDTLQSDLDAATVPGSSPDTEAPDTEAPETVTRDVSTPPTGPTPASSEPPTEPAASPVEVGGQLSSLYGPSVLGTGQKTCLGQTVLDDLGSTQLSAILDTGDAARDDETLVASLGAAARTCNIDPSAIFG